MRDITLNNMRALIGSYQFSECVLQAVTVSKRICETIRE